MLMINNICKPYLYDAKRFTEVSDELSAYDVGLYVAKPCTNRVETQTCNVVF